MLNHAIVHKHVDTEVLGGAPSTFVLCAKT